MEDKNQSLPRYVILSYRTGGFPGGPVVKNTTSSAGDEFSILDGGANMPHASELLSLRAKTKTQLRQK